MTNTLGKKVEVGILMPTREFILSNSTSISPLLDLAIRAEEENINSLWVSESAIARPRLEPLTLLGALSTITKRVKLGTAVLLPALHQPIQLAHTLSSLDILSQGRLIIGAGIGFDMPPTWNEFRALESPFEQRVGRLVESVKLYRSMWKSDKEKRTLSESYENRDDIPDIYKGDGRKNKYWDHTDVEVLPVPYQVDGPKLWIGSTLGLEASLKRVAYLFDGWMPMCPTPEKYAGELKILREWLNKIGRQLEDVEVACYLTLRIDSTENEAQQQLENFSLQYYGKPYELVKSLQAIFGGTPQQCVTWLNGYITAGVKKLIVRLAGADQEEQFSYFTKEVIPYLSQCPNEHSD